MIDLHTHSSCSDGSEPPAAIVERAARAGCTAVALTDHDTFAGLPEAAQRASELGIGFVAGCEVSCVSPAGTAHVLCYFADPATGPLGGELDRLATDREARNLVMIDKLVSLGVPISYDQVVLEAGGTGIGRPHFAAVLVRNKAASSIQDAFDRFLAKGAPGYVPKARVEIAEIVEVARASGAVSVLAHPLSLGLAGAALEQAIGSLASAGLSGIECYYGRYDPPTRASLVELAGRHRLVPTGGSDYHGSYKPDLEVGTGTGDLDVPDAVLDALEERRPPR